MVLSLTLTVPLPVDRLTNKLPPNVPNSIVRNPPYVVREPRIEGCVLDPNIFL